MTSVSDQWGVEVPCDLGVFFSSFVRFEAHAGATTFPPEVGVIAGARPYSRGPQVSRNTFSVSTITGGYARQ